MRSGRRNDLVIAGALAFFLFPLGACALSTFNAEEYLPTCGFAGRTDKPCGQCIAAKCQGLVDACCANESCREVPSDSVLGVSTSYGDPGALKRLDACAQGESCKDLESDPRVRDLAACIQESCGDSCDLWRKSTLVPEESSCEVSPATEYSPASCDCTIPATTEGAPTEPNSVRCNRKTVPTGICCASKDWPAPASTCRCSVVVCRLYSNACTCEIQTSKTEPVNACARGTCCIRAYDGTCGCGLSCGPDDIIVDQCTTAEVHCGGDRRTVESCSAD